MFLLVPIQTRGVSASNVTGCVGQGAGRARGVTRAPRVTGGPGVRCAPGFTGDPGLSGRISEMFVTVEGLSLGVVRGTVTLEESAL